MKIARLLTIVLGTLCMLGIPVGRCSECGLSYHGWALRDPRHQTCPRCGRGLEISNGYGVRSEGYSPLDCERYAINIADEINAPNDSGRHNHESDE